MEPTSWISFLPLTKTFYRLLKDHATKVGQLEGRGRSPGLYWCKCHPLSEFVITEDEARQFEEALA